MSPETRIAVGAAGVGAVGAWAAGWRWGAPTALAASLGAALSLLNYLWLKAGARALLPAAGEVSPRGVRSGALRFLTRLGLLGACLYAIFISHLLPFPPVVWGLFAIPLAAVGVAVLQLIADW